MNAYAINKDRLQRRQRTEGPRRVAELSCRCVAHLQFTGPACCDGSRELRIETATRGNYEGGEAFAVRKEGPIAGPGTHVSATARVNFGQGMGDKAALITGSRVSGVPRELCLGHVGAAAAAGRLIRLVDDGEAISTDAVERTLELLASNEVLETRRKDWRTPENCFADDGTWTHVSAAGAARKSTVTHPGGQAEVVCNADV